VFIYMSVLFVDRYKAYYIHWLTAKQTDDNQHHNNSNNIYNNNNNNEVQFE